jgi:Cu+-exporting ATPase
MSAADLAVIAGGVAATALLAWFFFAPKKTSLAELVGNVQEVKVTVKGGYSPDRVAVRQGVPLRILFDRQESGECTSRVVFPGFALNRSPGWVATRRSSGRAPGDASRSRSRNVGGRSR